MHRRMFLGAAAGALCVDSLTARCQPTARVYRLGLLSPNVPPPPSDRSSAMVLIPQGLRELGYVQGQNVVIERRWAEEKADRLPALVRELIALRVDVLVPIAQAAIREAKDATTTIPIVFYANFDPVAAGIVTNLPIIALAAKHRLPAMYEWREQVADGGLMAYGSSLAGTTRRVAAYIDRIFKGAKPADLPIEQPTKFELVINAKTAKALGLTIPQSLLLRADEVIQ